MKKKKAEEEAARKKAEEEKKKEAEEAKKAEEERKKAEEDRKKNEDEKKKQDQKEKEIKDKILDNKPTDPTPPGTNGAGVPPGSDPNAKPPTANNDGPGGPSGDGPGGPAGSSGSPDGSDGFGGISYLKEMLKFKPRNSFGDKLINLEGLFGYNRDGTDRKPKDCTLEVKVISNVDNGKSNKADSPIPNGDTKYITITGDRCKKFTISEHLANTSTNKSPGTLIASYAKILEKNFSHL